MPYFQKTDKKTTTKAKMFEVLPCLLLSTCAIDATWTEFSLFSCLKVLGFLVGFGVF